MPREWRIRIQDILDSIDKIRRYTHAMKYKDFVEDEKTLDAVKQNFVIIGEASRYTPEEIKAKHPEIPWSQMQGMRNIAVHRYFGVDPEALWKTLHEDLPPLVPKLERILESEA